MDRRDIAHVFEQEFVGCRRRGDTLLNRVIERVVGDVGGGLSEDGGTTRHGVNQRTLVDRRRIQREGNRSVASLVSYLYREREVCGLRVGGRTRTVARRDVALSAAGALIGDSRGPGPIIEHPVCRQYRATRRGYGSDIDAGTRKSDRSSLSCCRPLRPPRIARWQSGSH